MISKIKTFVTLFAEQEKVTELVLIKINKDIFLWKKN